jgi:hypothetical protein
VELQQSYPADDSVGQLALDALMAVDLQVPDKAEQTAYEFGKPLVEALMGVEGLVDDCIAFQSKSMISGSAGIFQMACVAASGLVDKWDTKIEGNQDEPGSDRDREIASILRRMLHIGSQMALLSSAYTFLPGAALPADPGVVMLRRTMLQLRLTAEIIARGGLLKDQLFEAKIGDFDWKNATQIARADNLARRYRLSQNIDQSLKGVERFQARRDYGDPPGDQDFKESANKLFNNYMNNRLNEAKAAEKSAKKELGIPEDKDLREWQWALPGVISPPTTRGWIEDLDNEIAEEWRALKIPAPRPMGDPEFDDLLMKRYKEKSEGLSGEVSGPLATQWLGGNKAVHEFRVNSFSGISFLSVLEMMRAASDDIRALLGMVHLDDDSGTDSLGLPNPRLAVEARARLMTLFSACINDFTKAKSWFSEEDAKRSRN